MGVGVAEVAEQLLEFGLVTVESCQARVLWWITRMGLRVWVAIEAEKVDLDAGIFVQGILQLARSTVNCQAGTISVLVGVEKNICAIVFVVAAVTHASVD